ncbi:hypothetical protein ANN_10260, partial [Periplaneta americana]
MNPYLYMFLIPFIGAALVYILCKLCSDKYAHFSLVARDTDNQGDGLGDSVLWHGHHYLLTYWRGEKGEGGTFEASRRAIRVTSHETRVLDVAGRVTKQRERETVEYESVLVLVADPIHRSRTLHIAQVLHCRFIGTSSDVPTVISESEHTLCNAVLRARNSCTEHCYFGTGGPDLLFIFVPNGTSGLSPVQENYPRSDEAARQPYVITTSTRQVFQPSDPRQGKCRVAVVSYLLSHLFFYDLFG